MAATPVEATYRHQHLLGTVIDIRVRAEHSTVCDAAHRTIVDEIVRLQAVFSVFDAQSELSRWKRDEVASVSVELTEVMSLALHWQQRSEGAFNPLVGAISDVWRRSESVGSVPTPAELADVVDSIQQPRYAVEDGTLRRTGDCTALDLNAIAKGFIVDRATDAAAEAHDISMVLVSAGGDLVHRGQPARPVGIENPQRPYDNEPPLTIISLADAGLATSGGSRRGFRIGPKHLSHVVDPRTGRPVEAQASITVVAPTAASADVMATVLGMTDPATAIDASNGLADCACFIVGPDGEWWPNRHWLDRFGEPARPTSA